MDEPQYLTTTEPDDGIPIVEQFTPGQQKRVNDIVRHKLGEGRAKWQREIEAKHAAAAQRIEALEHQVTRLLSIIEWQVKGETK